MSHMTQGPGICPNINAEENKVDASQSTGVVSISQENALPRKNEIPKQTKKLGFQFEP